MTCETIVDELYAELPEFRSEVMTNPSWEDFDEHDRRSAHLVVSQLASWYCLVADEHRDELLDRASSFLERASIDAAHDAELENLLLLELGEGFPFSERAWASSGPATRALILRGNDGRRPEPLPLSLEEIEAQLDAERSG